MYVPRQVTGRGCYLRFTHALGAGGRGTLPRGSHLRGRPGWSNVFIFHPAFSLCSGRGRLGRASLRELPRESGLVPNLVMILLPSRRGSLMEARGATFAFRMTAVWACL